MNTGVGLFLDDRQTVCAIDTHKPVTAAGINLIRTYGADDLLQDLGEPVSVSASADQTAHIYNYAAQLAHIVLERAIMQRVGIASRDVVLTG